MLGREFPTSGTHIAGPTTRACQRSSTHRRHYTNPWAAELYGRAVARGHDHPPCVRIFARASLYVVWHCQQDNTAYDPTDMEHSNASSKAATTQRLDTRATHGGQALGVASCDEDDLYAVMDWALQRKEAIENTLAAQH